MPRPLLEIWRELNRDSDHKPSALLKFGRKLDRDESSFKQAFAELNREPSPTLKQALAGLDPDSSPTLKQAFAGLDRDQSSSPKRMFTSIESSAAPTLGREWREMRERVNRIQEESGVAERVLGKPRPIPPTQPVKPAQPSKRKRKPGGGRKPSLTPEDIKKGIGILRSHDRMTVEAARQTLRDAGIDTNNTSLYDLVIKTAYGSR